MKKSTELHKGLDIIMNNIEALKAENKVAEVRVELEKAKNLKEEIILQEEIEHMELENFEGTPINATTAKKQAKNMGEVKAMSGRLFKNAVMPGEQMADKFKTNVHNEVDIGRLARGVMTGSWENAVKEREYLNAIQSTGDGKVLIPQHLSMDIFDMARAKSAVFGKVPTVQLNNGNLTIAKIVNDSTAYFVAEGEAIPMSGMAFAPVKLKSKMLAMLVPVSEILLKDGQNVSEALYMAMSGAIAEAMDKALLYGVGDGTEEAKEPKGILTYANINKDTFTGSIKYIDLVKGVKPIAKANLGATDAVMPTDEYLDLLSSTNNNGDYLSAPKALEGVSFDGSNNVNIGEAVTLDRNSVVVGVSSYLVFDKGYVSNQFQKIEKTFRLYVGVDIALVNSKGVTHLTLAG